MEYTYPAYYKKFQCIGGACPATCCAGWEIVIDEKSLKRYKEYPGGFGNRLRNSIDFNRKSFKQYDNRRCAFLNEDNLCDIYSEAGEDMLCKTCKRYPRHMEEYENVREWSLSLSCPEAAKFILFEKEFKLQSSYRETKEEDYGDFDQLLFSQLLDSRDVLFKMMSTGTSKIAEGGMLLALSFAHHLQKHINEGDLFGVADLYERYGRQGAGEAYRQYCLKKWGSHQTDRHNTSEIELSAQHEKDYSEISRFKLMRAMFQSLHQLEVLSKDWPEWLMKCEEELFSHGEAHYREIISSAVLPDSVKRQLMDYFIYVYFAGAVYDGNTYTKVKMAVVSTMLIEEMFRVKYLEVIQEETTSVKEKQQEEKEAVLEVAYRYARELEHSDLNLKRMGKMLEKKECFKIENLMKSMSFT